MTINETVFRGKKVITIDGKVDGFQVNPSKPEHIKTYTNGKQPWTPTHRYNLIVDGQPISLGMGDKDGVSDRQVIQGKDNDGKYHALVKGLEVSVEVTENGEYQGKTQYQSSNSKVVVIDASGAETPQKSGGNTSQGSYTPKEPYDETGMLVCHGINGAMNLVSTGRFGNSNEEISDLAKSVHEATVRLKKKVAEDNPTMKDKSVGNYSGNAIHAACLVVGNAGNLADDLFNMAYDIVCNVTLPLDAYIRTPKQEAKPAVKTTRAAPKPKAATKATPVVEEEVFPELDDDSSELPF